LLVFDGLSWFVMVCHGLSWLALVRIGLPMQVYDCVGGVSLVWVIPLLLSQSLANFGVPAF
jgi:hypothetical protein